LQNFNVLLFNLRFCWNFKVNGFYGEGLFWWWLEVCVLLVLLLKNFWWNNGELFLLAFLTL
jgi:hypothetical protein